MGALDIPNLSPAIAQRGKHSDFDEGIVLAEIAAGELIRHTPRDGSWTSYGTGGTVTLGRSEFSSAEGSDRGLAQMWVISVPGAINNVAVLRFSIPPQARKVGAGWLSSSSLSGSVSVDFILDGRPYAGPDPRYRFLDDLTPQSSVEQEWHYIIENDLPPVPDGRPHTLDIVVTADVAGATTQTVRVYGLLLERRLGLTEAPRVAEPITPTAVPTSSGFIASGQSGASSVRVFRGTWQIVYTNTGGSPATVTVTDNSVTAWAKSIAAGDSATLDFRTLTNIAGWKHVASAAGINCTIVGGW